MAPPPASDVRQALSSALKERMAARDRVAVEVLRVAIGAVDNAGAQPIEHLPGTGWSAREEAPASAEVGRRELTSDEAQAIVLGEAAELDAAATEYLELGRPDVAERVVRQAEILRAVLADAPSGEPA